MVDDKNIPKPVCLDPTYPQPGEISQEEYNKASLRLTKPPTPAMFEPPSINQTQLEESIKTQQAVKNEAKFEEQSEQEQSIPAPITEPVKLVEEDAPIKEVPVKEEPVTTTEPAQVQVGLESAEFIDDNPMHFSSVDELRAEINNEDSKLKKQQEELQKLLVDGDISVPEGYDASEYYPTVEGLPEIQSSPKKLSFEELNACMSPDVTTSYFKAFEGIDSINDKMLKAKPVSLDAMKFTVKTFENTPDFSMKKNEIEARNLSGKRRVQVVCAQSGYSCIIEASSRMEQRSYERLIANSDTYAGKMQLLKATFNKIKDFSCGPMTFEEWGNITAYPDLETIYFGMHNATFPRVNTYSIECPNEMCPNEDRMFSAPIGNSSLIYIAPGDVTMKTINDVLYNSGDPKELITKSKRANGLRIFVENKKKYFAVRVPSIFEFYEKSYKNKVNKDLEQDAKTMYTGFIKGVGSLDVDLWSRTNVVEYYLETDMNAILYALQNLEYEDRVKLDAMLINFINTNQIQYQIPRIRCPHCKTVIEQVPIVMEQFFFEMVLKLRV